jgi:hypothetical protein
MNPPLLDPEVDLQIPFDPVDREDSDMLFFWRHPP